MCLVTTRLKKSAKDLSSDTVHSDLRSLTSRQSSRICDIECNGGSPPLGSTVEELLEGADAELNGGHDGQVRGIPRLLYLFG